MRRRIALVELDDLPPELAQQIDPSIVPSPSQPSGTRTNYNDPAFADEWREEKEYIQNGVLQLAGGQTVSTPQNVLTLQRPWPMVGFGVSVGNLPAGGGNQIEAFLFALVKGQRVAIAAQAITVASSGGFAVGQVVQAGAKCELVLIVTFAAPGGSIAGIKANLWGSPFR